MRLGRLMHDREKPLDVSGVMTSLLLNASIFAGSATHKHSQTVSQKRRLYSGTGGRWIEFRNTERELYQDGSFRLSSTRSGTETRLPTIGPVVYSEAPDPIIGKIQQQRENVRRNLTICIGVVWSLALVYTASLIAFKTYSLDQVKDVALIILAPITSLFTAVVGFYIGASEK